MEQPCYKCGQTVEEGRVFCPHCGAPQIRVVLAEAAVGAGIGQSIPRVDLTASETVPVIAIPMRWSQAARPCAIAALIAAVGMVLKLINPLIAAIGAGFLAVAIYRRQNPGITMQARTGARIGAVCGFFCAGMTAILGAVRVAVCHEGGAIRAMLLESVKQTAATYSDPQYQPGLNFMRSDAGLALMLVFLIVVAWIGLILLGMLGGAIGGASLGQRERS